MRTALTLLLLISSFANAADRQHVLWSVKGKQNTVYLLGSMHLLPKNEQLPPAMLEAYKDAEQLVMEIDMDDLDPVQVQSTMLQLGMLPADRSLQTELGEETYAQVAATASEFGLNPMILQRMQPWLAGLTLMQLQFAKLGFDPQAGVEQQFVRMAASDDKEISGLESLDEQIKLLASLPPALQKEFVMYSVNDAERLAREVNDLTTAWRTGDIDELEALLLKSMQAYPKLYEPLTVDRNRAWMSRIQPLLREQDDFLVVVGAAHLVGKDSVIELLERSGAKVKRH